MNSKDQVTVLVIERRSGRVTRLTPSEIERMVKSQRTGRTIKLIAVKGYRKAKYIAKAALLIAGVIVTSIMVIHENNRLIRRYGED